MEEQGPSSLVWKFVRSITMNPIKAGILAAIVLEFLGEKEKEYVEAAEMKWEVMVDFPGGRKYLKFDSDDDPSHLIEQAQKYAKDADNGEVAVLRSGTHAVMWNKTDLVKKTRDELVKKLE